MHPKPLRTTRRARATLAAATLSAALSISCGSEADGAGSSAGRTYTEDVSLARAFEVKDLEVDVAEAGPGRANRAYAVPATVGFDESRRAVVVARVEGAIARVHVELGEDVSAGDPLVELASRELSAARVALVDAERRTAFALRVREREERLFGIEATSESEVEAARQAEADAELDVLAAREILLVFGVDPDEVSGVRSDDRGSDDRGSDDDHESDATHAMQRTELTRLTLRAPIAGRIVARHATLGEAVMPDSALLEVADLSRVWVDARMPAATLEALSLDDEVRVRSRELGLDVAAKIDYVDPRVDPGTQSVLVRATVPRAGAGAALRPGLFVVLAGETAAPESPLVVPVSAVQSVEDTTWVFVAPRSGLPGRWQAREVVLGTRGDRVIEVVEGLVAGEKVAVSETLVLKSVWLGVGGEDE